MIMQWLDRSCCYKTFGIKSPKTELRLKGYRVFKLQGLNTKIGARLQFAEKPRALV
jgi:hypothetical protein